MRTIWKADILSTAIIATTFMALALFSFRPSSGLQLFVIATLLLCLGVGVRSLFSLHRNQGYRCLGNYLPLLAIVASVLLGPSLGQFLRDQYFLIRVEEWQEQIASLPDCTLDDGVTVSGIPVSVQVASDGNRYVLFWWGSGFPLRHSVLAYHPGSPEQARETFRKQWKGRLLRKNWYLLSG